MRTVCAILGCGLLVAALLLTPATTQPDPASPLLPGDVTVAAGQGSFGQPVQTVSGVLTNTTTDSAYTGITLTAAVYDAADVLVGEGFGLLTDACGLSVPADHALLPGQQASFTFALEIYEQDAAIDRIEVTAQGNAAPPPPPADLLPAGITELSRAEVVNVEWDGTRRLRYATGCLDDLFIAWDWFSYNQINGRTQSIEHPRADAVTETLRNALRLTNEPIFLRSRLSFDPDGTRLVYQDQVNYVYTAAADGRFSRLLYLGLNSYTLQEIYWLADDRFIAYYYGAIGDEVIYFTADAESRPISPAPLTNRPSVIRPGASADGRRIVLAGTFDDPATDQPVTGYFISVVGNGFFEPLFEAAPPGNNYPSPIPLLNAAGDRVDRVYIAREVDGQPVMQCFNRDEGVLYDLALLPFGLTPGHRAQWYLAPNQRSIALAADGVQGGLWWIDLAALPACAAVDGG